MVGTWSTADVAAVHRREALAPVRMSSPFSASFHQRLLELERKFRQMRQQDPDRRRGGASMCMTSPLPRRPMPLAIGKNRARQESFSTDFDDRRAAMDACNGAWQRSVAAPSDSERRLHEIMKLNGVLRFGDRVFKTLPSDLQLVGELGHGTCGHVVKMLHKRTGHVVAVKQMCRSGNREENKRIIMDLDVVLRSHECPYIVRCLGCFITDSEVWICMELMATCFEKLSKRLRRGIPEPILGKTALSVVSALHYLKERQGIMHRDVKPSNILIDWNGTVKLCDFGISGRLVDSKAKTRTAGCVAYMAPERVDPPDPFNADYDIRADVWSLGVSLVELATGTFPYRDCSTDFELLTRIIQDDPPLLKTSDDFTPSFCDFVARCLTKEYEHRPKYVQLLQHNFLIHYERTPVDMVHWLKSVMVPLSRETGGVRATL